MNQNFQQMKNALPRVLFAATLMAILTLPVNSQLLDPTTQAKFVNPLPIPAQIDATTGLPIDMQMAETFQSLGLTDPVLGTPLMTRVWGYGLVGGTVTYPGPTFIASKNVPVNVTFNNNLPGHFLPVDPTLHMAHPHGTNAADFYAAGNVPTVPHLHGGNTESASDGLPEAWYTQNFGILGPQFVKQQYTYHNTQEAATLWYHDHALGITRLNVYAGLAGFYLLEDMNERTLVKDGVLPKGKQDIEIVIQDRMFDVNGQLFLPATTNDPWFGDAWGNDPGGEILDLPYDPSIVAEFFGNFILVNGVAWPALQVEPRPYRFRFLNGSDSRFYVLEFGSGATKMSFLQIATEDGLLPEAISSTEFGDRLIIAPGERAEVVVDFSTMVNQNITLYNYGPDEPYKGASAGQTPADPNTTGQVMQFQVTAKLKVNKGLPIPTVAAGTTLRPAIADLGAPAATRKLALFEGMDSDGRLQPLLGVINGDDPKSSTTLNGSLAWFEDITENPGLNDVEVWEVYNTTEDAHPIHLHLVAFQIIDRQPFEAVVGAQPQAQHDGQLGEAGYVVESSIQLTGPAEEPAVNEKGWKDTFIVPPGYVGRVKARFDRTGRYVWHCHILSHEDHEMMRPYYVGAMAAAAGLKGASIQNNGPFVEEHTGFKVYPNPVMNIAHIEFGLEESANVVMNLYSFDGRLILSDELGLMEKGYYSHSLTTENMKDGVYILELKAGNKLHRERILIAR